MNPISNKNNPLSNYINITQSLGWGIFKEVFGTINIPTPNALRYLTARFGYSQYAEGCVASYLFEVKGCSDVKLFIKIHGGITIVDLLINRYFYNRLYEKYLNEFTYPRDFELKSDEMENIANKVRDIFIDFKDNPVCVDDDYFTIIGDFDFKNNDIDSVKIYELKE